MDPFLANLLRPEDRKYLEELESNLGLLLRLRSHQPIDEHGSSCHEHVS